MPNRTNRVHVAVSDSQKSRWEEHVEDPTTSPDNLSDLVRKAVSEEVQGDGTGSVFDDDLVEEMQALDDGIQDVESRIRILETKTITEDDLEEILEIHRDYLIDKIDEINTAYLSSISEGSQEENND